MTPRTYLRALSLPAALAVVLAAVVQDVQDPAGPDAAPKIGVVDLDRVLTNYPGARGKEQELVEMGQGFDAQLKALRDELDVLESARIGFEEGTPEFLDADLQVRLKALEYEKTLERFDMLARRKGAEVRLELYEELRRGIAEFAKARGLGLVLRARNTADGDSRNVRLESNQAADVVFHAASVDITDDVIQFLKTWK